MFKAISTNFIALNEDPFLLLDLSQMPWLDQVSQLTLSLGLIHEPNYQRSLNHLRQVVDSQAESIVRLGNKSHETQANIDSLNHQLITNQDELRDLKARTADYKNLKADNDALREALSTINQSLASRLKRKIQTLFKS